VHEDKMELNKHTNRKVTNFESNLKRL